MTVASSNHRNLVIMPYGKNSLVSSWFNQSSDRPFDVVLLCYHSIDQVVPPPPGVRIYEFLNYKWWMIYDFFQSDESVLKEYDSFFFLDDDIEISKQQIVNLFSWFNSGSLLLAQPALTSDSYMSWKVLRHRRCSGFRYVNTIELMCPLMKRQAVKFLLPTFKLTKSGWGVDLLWGKQIWENFGKNKIAVFDLIQVRHNKPVGKGELYSKLDQSAKSEEDIIRTQYGLENFCIREVKSWSNTLAGRLVSFFRLNHLKC